MCVHMCTYIFVYYEPMHFSEFYYYYYIIIIIIIIIIITLSLCTCAVFETGCKVST